MGFVPIQHDATVLAAISMEIVPEPLPVDGFPSTPGVSTPNTIELFGPSQSRMPDVPLLAMSSGGNARIPFQFPPVIKADSKSATWKEVDGAYYEPISVLWMGASARKITLYTKYIITGSAPYTVSGVAAITHLIKSYFYRNLIDVTQQHKLPVVKLKLYESAPGGESTWRVGNVNISHDGAFISDSGTVFQLVTEVTWELMMITQVGLGTQIDSSLPKFPRKEWY